MVRIKQIVFYTEDFDKQANCYCKAFDLTQKNENASGAIYPSERDINLTLLKRRGIVKTGLHPFVFDVESFARIRYNTNHPDRNPFDISENGWEV